MEKKFVVLLFFGCFFGDSSGMSSSSSSVFTKIENSATISPYVANFGGHLKDVILFFPDKAILNEWTEIGKRVYNSPNIFGFNPYNDFPTSGHWKSIDSIKLKFKVKLDFRQFDMPSPNDDFFMMPIKSSSRFVEDSKPSYIPPEVEVTWNDGKSDKPLHLLKPSVWSLSLDKSMFSQAGNILSLYHGDLEESLMKICLADKFAVPLIVYSLKSLDNFLEDREDYEDESEEYQVLADDMPKPTQNVRANCNIVGSKSYLDGHILMSTIILELQCSNIFQVSEYIEAIPRSVIFNFSEGEGSPSSSTPYGSSSSDSYSVSRYSSSSSGLRRIRSSTSSPLSGHSSSHRGDHSFSSCNTSTSDESSEGSESGIYATRSGRQDASGSNDIVPGTISMLGVLGSSSEVSVDIILDDLRSKFYRDLSVSKKNSKPAIATHSREDEDDASSEDESEVRDDLHQSSPASLSEGRKVPISLSPDVSPMGSEEELPPGRFHSLRLLEEDPGNTFNSINSLGHFINAYSASNNLSFNTLDNLRRGFAQPLISISNEGSEEERESEDGREGSEIGSRKSDHHSLHNVDNSSGIREIGLKDLFSMH